MLRLYKTKTDVVMLYLEVKCGIYNSKDETEHHKMSLKINYKIQFYEAYSLHGYGEFRFVYRDCFLEIRTNIS